jgi:hypothetical protein
VDVQVEEEIMEDQKMAAALIEVAEDQVLVELEAEIEIDQVPEPSAQVDCALQQHRNLLEYNQT